MKIEIFNTSSTFGRMSYSQACRQMNSLFDRFKTQHYIPSSKETKEPLKVLGEYLQKKLNLKKPLNFRFKWFKDGYEEGVAGNLEFYYKGKKRNFLWFQNDKIEARKLEEKVQGFDVLDNVIGALQGKNKIDPSLKVKVYF